MSADHFLQGIKDLPISFKEVRDLEKIFSKFPLDILQYSGYDFLANSREWRSTWENARMNIDFPHNLLHSHRVAKNGLIIGAILKLDNKDIMGIHEACLWHDFGRTMIPSGVANNETHKLASVAFRRIMMNTLSFADSKTIERAIVLHDKDVLPKTATPVDRAVRDADRLELVGWSGMFRRVYYPPFDYKDEKLYKTETDFLDLDAKEHFLFDKGVPWEKGYEKGTKRYVLKHVFPFLVKNNLVYEMYKSVQESWKYINGVRGSNGKWKIEPIMQIVKEGFHRKLAANSEFSSLLLMQHIKQKVGLSPDKTLELLSQIIEQEVDDKKHRDDIRRQLRSVVKYLI